MIFVFKFLITDMTFLYEYRYTMLKDEVARKWYSPQEQLLYV